jgi:hypothetical protein
MLLGALLLGAKSVLAVNFQMADTQQLLKSENKLPLNQYISGNILIFNSKAMPARYWQGKYREISGVLSQVKAKGLVKDGQPFGLIMENIPLFANGYRNVVHGIESLKDGRFYFLGINNTNFDIQDALAVEDSFKKMPYLKVLMLKDNRLSQAGDILESANQYAKLNAVYFEGTTMSDQQLQKTVDQITKAKSIRAFGLTLDNNQQVQGVIRLLAEPRYFKRIHLRLQGKVDAENQEALLSAVKNKQAKNLKSFSISVSRNFILAPNFHLLYNKLVDASPKLHNIYLSLSTSAAKRQLSSIIANLSRYNNKPFYLALYNTPGLAKVSESKLKRLGENNNLKSITINEGALKAKHYKAIAKGFQNRKVKLQYFSIVKNNMPQETAKAFFPSVSKGKVGVVNVENSHDSARLVGALKDKKMKYQLSSNSVMFGSKQKPMQEYAQTHKMRVTSTGLVKNKSGLRSNLLEQSKSVKGKQGEKANEKTT